MRAVLMEQGKLWVEDIPAPKPGRGEVLVKSLACGICGSDLHAAQHTHDFVTTSRASGGAFKLMSFDPVVLGHEFSAEIVEFGPGTEKRLKPGNLVCSIPMLMGPTPQAVGYNPDIPGGFGEYMVLTESLLLPVPTGISADVAALTEPMAVGLHAVNKAHLHGDEAAVVIGSGPVGLAVITALKAKGIGPVIAADFSAGRRQYASTQGADVLCDPDRDNPFDRSIIAGRPVVVFECVGVPGVINDIFSKAPANTRIVVVGVCLQQDHFHALPAINKELSVQFVLGYTPREFKDSLEHIADGQFDVRNLISDQIPLDGVAAAFETLRQPDTHAKVIVKPWQ